MAGTKTLIGAVLVGAALGGGAVIPLTGDQYKDGGASKLVMSATTVAESYRWVDKTTGDVVAVADDAKAEYVPVEQVTMDEAGNVVSTKIIPEKDVRLDTIKEYVRLPDPPRIRSSLTAGKKYEVQLLEDGKIAAVAEYTPETDQAVLVKITAYNDVAGTTEEK